MKLCKIVLTFNGAVSCFFFTVYCKMIAVVCLCFDLGHVVSVGRVRKQCINNNLKSFPVYI